MNQINVKKSSVIFIGSYKPKQFEDKELWFNLDEDATYVRTDGSCYGHHDVYDRYGNVVGYMHNHCCKHE